MTAVTAPARGSVRRRALIAAAALPGLLVVASGVVMAALDGGFPKHVWYAVALFLLALLAVAIAVRPPRPAERVRLLEVGLAAYGLFCAWSYTSILWADAPGDAWDGANRTLLYGIVLAIVGLRPWGGREAAVALGALVAGAAALAGGVLAASAGGGVERLFLEGRLSEPLGYSNATANFWLVALWPALGLAAARAVPWPARAAALGAAALLLQVAVLSQSRAAAIAFVPSAVLFLVLSPRRVPALVALATVLAVTGAALETLLGVHEAATVADLATAMADARPVIAGGCAVALVAGLAAALADARVLVSSRLARAGDLGVLGLLAALAVAAVLAIGDPIAWAQARWDDFRYTGYSRVDQGVNRFTGSLGSSRYDFYRVALDQFAARPVLGIGADNFAASYLVERRTREAPRYPHSFALRTLAQLGLVGAALFAAFLGAALWAAARTLRRAPPLEAGLAVAALAGFAIWFSHGLVDWLFEFPALGVVAFALLALAVRVAGPRAPGSAGGVGGDREPLEPGSVAEARGDPEPTEAGGARGRAPGVAARAVLAALVLAAGASFALPGLAARYTAAAYDAAGGHPVRSIENLERAASLDRLSAEPLVAKGILARRSGDLTRARSALTRALAREPRNWFGRFQLGMLLALQGQRPLAERELGAAQRLNPRQPLVADVRRRVARGAAIDPSRVERTLYGQLSRRLRPTGAAR